MYTLRKFNDPILKQKCVPLTVGDDLSFLRDMKRMCVENRGAGLAAPQIGLLHRAFVMFPGRDGKGMCVSLVNPVVVETGDATLWSEEACLSYPGVKVLVQRHRDLVVEYYDWRWRKQRGRFSCWEARIVQHEMDHLNGVCVVGDEWRRLSGE